VSPGEAHGPPLLDDAEAGLFRIDRRVFVDEALLRRELREVFDACWLYLGHESELAAPNDFITRSVGGRPLIYLRDGDGVLRAFINSCRHRGTEVCPKKSGNARLFRCPYHAWTYANDGSLIGVPGQDAYGPAFDRSRLGLVPVPRLASYRGFVFVCFTPEGPSLREYLGGAADYLDLICDQAEGGWEVLRGTYLHSMKTNWKVLADNSTDLYHLPYAHGRYVDFLKGEGTSDDQIRRTGRVHSLGGGHAVAVSSPPSGGRPIAYWAPAFPAEMKERIDAKRRALVERHGAERAQQMAETNRGLFIFPNVIFNDNMAVTVRTFYPTAVDAVSISLWALAPVAEETPDRKLRLDSLLTFVGPGGFGTPDDVEILESCQRAYASPEIRWNDASRGMLREAPFHTDELQNRTFWREWARLLGLDAHTTAGEPVTGRSHA
jgi:p-cumate 2,3-dioxygenase subunit alpha